MIRNGHVEELPVFGYVIGVPCLFIPALLFHFANLYTGRVYRKAIVLIWIATIVLLMLSLTGRYWKVDGIYSYDWGNIFKVVPGIFDYLSVIVWFGVNLTACWILYQCSRSSNSAVERRHYLYITAGFLVITIAPVKAGVVMGINIPILLPLGMLLVDIFNAIIGIAIIKDKLFDITIIVKKGTLYSVLAAVLIFVYSLVEHILVTFIGEKFGEGSNFIHFISIAVGIAVLMPFKNRIELSIEGYFAHRQLEF